MIEKADSGTDDIFYVAVPWYFYLPLFLWIISKLFIY